MLLIYSSIQAQTVIKYKMPDGQVFSKQVFDALKKNMEKQGLEFKVIDSTIVGNNTTRIVDIKSKGYFEAKENNEKFDPFAKFKENIGKRFKIEQFKKQEGNNYEPNELFGKPTIINFWFTSCAPCIAEMPYLINLKNNFGNKVNYLSVTFDDRAKVNSFLEKKNFPFEHITNAKEQINNLEISSYPMTYLLDNEGKIYQVYGGLSDYEYDEIKKTIEKKLL
jgi:thiol-disulfide isomerase/thioredoxin